MSKALLLLYFLLALSLSCVHDQFAHNVHKHIYNDLHEPRLLQQATIGRFNHHLFSLRIFADYQNLTTGSPTEINTIKRIVNITASYFYRVLKVARLPVLYFPNNISRQCKK